MDLYTVRSGTRYRLGTVRSMETRGFRVAQEMMEPAGSLRLLADPSGSRVALQTTDIHVTAGDNVALLLAENLRLSSFAIDRSGKGPIFGAPAR